MSVDPDGWYIVVRLRRIPGTLDRVRLESVAIQGWRVDTARAEGWKVACEDPCPKFYEPKIMDDGA